MAKTIDPALSLRGNFVELIPLETHHEMALVDAAADGELWNLLVTSVPNAGQMAKYIQFALKNRAASMQQPFVVRRVSDEKIVGCTRYYDIDLINRNRSIGYTWYSESVQRSALNTECKLLLLSHAFESQQCISVAFHTDQLNVRSQAAIERLGATKEGVLRNHRIMPNGRIRHTWCYSVLDDEWPDIKATLNARLERG